MRIYVKDKKTGELGITTVHGLNRALYEVVGPVEEAAEGPSVAPESPPEVIPDPTPADEFFGIPEGLEIIDDEEPEEY